MVTLLFILAVLLFVFGVVRIISGDLLVGVILIVLACLVGPGGYSIFR